MIVRDFDANTLNVHMVTDLLSGTEQKIEADVRAENKEEKYHP